MSLTVGSVRPPAEAARMGPREETGVDEAVKQLCARLLVELPEAAGLRQREGEPGHLEVLGVDAAKQVMMMIRW